METNEDKVVKSSDTDTKEQYYKTGAIILAQTCKIKPSGLGPV